MLGARHVDAHAVYELPALRREQIVACAQERHDDEQSEGLAHFRNQKSEVRNQNDAV
jgi:hypothetical protein